MTVVVTGGAGFIGAHFIRRWLTRHPDAALINIDLLTYAGSAARLVDVAAHPGYAFQQLDISDRPAVTQALRGCQVLVHFAAETHVDRSITDGAPFLRTNVEGTYQLLEAAREARVERIVHISTDEVYGPIATGAVDETALLAPSSPYAASKAGGDLLAQAFFHTHQLPVIVARPTNVYGPGQFPEKFIPLCITNALRDQPLPIYGDGQQRRGWLLVTELCEALELLVERGVPGEIYNIGSGHERANLDTGRAILARMGKPERLLSFVQDRPGHDRRYAMRDEKIRALGWRARISFEQGLTETIAWYQAQEAWWAPLTRGLREDPYHWLNRPAGAGAQPPTRRSA